jgi:hypothetical protein
MKNTSTGWLILLFFLCSFIVVQSTNASIPVYDIISFTPVAIRLWENVKLYEQVSFVQSGVGVQDVNFRWYVNGTEVFSENSTSSTLIYTPQTIGTYLINATVNGYSNGQVVTVTVIPQTAVNFENITAEIQPLSPEYNGSYTGDIPLNLTIGYASQTATNSTVIPYQEIACQYQIDNGSWLNATLVSASKQNVWYDPTFRGFWNQMDCSYNGSLKELSNGKHSMNVTLNPSLMYSYFVLSNGSSLFYHDKNGVYNALVNSTVDFYVFDNFDATAPNNSAHQSSTFPTIVGIVAVSITTTAAILLLYRRHQIR